MTAHWRSSPVIEPLASPLDGPASSIQLLLDRFFRSANGRAAAAAADDKRSRLELIRHAVDATGAAEVDIATREVTATAGDCDSLVLSGPFLERISTALADEAVLGFAGMQLEDAELRWLVVLPHRHSGLAAALVLTNPAPAFLRAGEPVAVALQFLWRQLPIDDLMSAEARTLALLRGKFGRLPSQMYQVCLHGYQELLNSLVMVFEPVMLLSERPEMVGIHGWEALARRDLTARKAPAEILMIADTWGDRFVIERDSILAVKALCAYRQAHARGPWKHDIPKPVSVNVSVRSLLSDAYENALGQAISDAGLAPHMVTLEISEHDAIEPFPGEENWGDTPITFFQNRLRELANKLGVNFAVDDFGVGYATLDRISSLQLAQIKVDRAILHHSMAKKEYELVVALAKEALHQGRSATPRIVVAEGVDAESPVSLHDLYELGVNHVQGYITGAAAGPSLEPLSEEVRRMVAAQVRTDEVPG